MLKDGKILQSSRFYPRADIKIGEKDGWPVALIEGPAPSGNKGMIFAFDCKALSRMKSDMEAAEAGNFNKFTAKSDLEVVKRALIKLQEHLQEPAIRALQAIKAKDPDWPFPFPDAMP